MLVVYCLRLADKWVLHLRPHWTHSQLVILPRKTTEIPSCLIHPVKSFHMGNNSFIICARDFVAVCSPHDKMVLLNQLPRYHQMFLLALWAYSIPIVHNPLYVLANGPKHNHTNSIVLYCSNRIDTFVLFPQFSCNRSNMMSSL